MPLGMALPAVEDHSPNEPKDNCQKGILLSIQWQNEAQRVTFRQELFIKENALLTGIILI